MKEVLLCFFQKINMGADLLSELFHREKTNYDLSLHPRKRKAWGICWFLFLLVWEGIERFLLIYLLVLLPVSVPRSIMEMYRIENFLCLLIFVQFLGGVGAPLGSRHRKESATLRAQVFWERSKDLIYMPFVLYALTYSTGFSLPDCTFITLLLIMTRLIVEVAFLALSRKLQLTKRGEDVVYYGVEALLCITGYALVLLRLGTEVGLIFHSVPFAVVLIIGGVLSAWRIFRYE